jgi:outer membrane protein
MKKIIMFLACGLLIGNVALAQSPKFGWINSSELLASMPEKAKADTTLAIYARSFQEQLEAMGKEYQSKMQLYQSQSKTMTDAMREVKEKEITDLQNRIESTQQSAESKVQQKKQEVYTPILDRANKAVTDVAKEKGYDYIFDVAQGAVLYEKDGDNVLPVVKAKLGIK